MLPLPGAKLDWLQIGLKLAKICCEKTCRKTPQCDSCAMKRQAAMLHVHCSPQEFSGSRLQVYQLLDLFV